jgi:hypothetical protein
MNPSAMNRWRIVWAASAVIVALSGCSSDSQSDSRVGQPNSVKGTAGTATGQAGRSGAAGAFSSQPDTPLIGISGAPAMTASGTGGATTSGSPNVTTAFTSDTCGPGNAAGLNDLQVKALMAGGAPGSMRMLYPYDQTVFPRGMLAPTLMWDGADGKAVYVHIQSKRVDYRGCLMTTGPQQLLLPQDVWQQASERSGGPSDPYTVEVAVQGPSGPIGPIKIQIIIAQATIKGSIYYNSYSGVGAIYRIPPGGMVQPFLAGTGCYGCHTVSANGARLMSSTGGGPGGSFEITPTTQSNPTMLAVAPGAAFSGLSPDGKIYVETAHPNGAVRPQGTPADTFLVNDAAMYETDTATMIPDTGIPLGAMMPIFSPDGRRLAFNDYGNAAGLSLSVMDFDPMTRKATNARVVFKDVADSYPGWPFFLPDNKALVFARGLNPQFSGAGAGVFPGLPIAGPGSDLFIVDIASGTSTILAKAMGLNSPQDQTGYLPFGTEELHQHYYPTVSPVAAGGYFWVFFDSIRHYGNQGIARQLWGSALRISADGAYNGDPSAPAFYVTGQDFMTGNHRAFTALDACKQNGNKCTSGTDCCGGFCYVPKPQDEFNTEVEGMCTSDVPQCSRTSDRCVADTDCCNPTDKCLNGYCGQIIAPQ